MRLFLFFCLCLSLFACASVESIPRLNQTLNRNQAQLKQIRIGIHQDYYLTHAQYVSVLKEASEERSSSLDALTVSFDQLTAIKNDFEERSQRLLEETAIQQKSWQRKVQVTSKDPEWESLKAFKKYSKDEYPSLLEMHGRYQKLKKSFDANLQHKDLRPYTQNLPRRHWEARTVLQEYELEQAYQKYNKALLEDLAKKVAVTPTDFESLAKLAQFEKHSKQNQRRHGRFPRGVSGPDQETKQKASEIISSVINPNIVSAAKAFAAKQNASSNAVVNLAPISSGPFSDLAQYTSPGNLRIVQKIFDQRKAEILEEVVRNDRWQVRQLLASSSSAENRLRKLVSSRNEFGKRCRQAINEPTIKKYLKELQRQRVDLLLTLEPRIVATINSAHSLSDLVDPLKGLAAQEDKKTPVVKRIDQARQKKMKELTAFRPVRNASQLSVGSFTTRGLNLETELMAIYLGDFGNSRLKPDSMLVSAIFNNYLYAFGRYCDAYLPANKVPITETVCTEEEVFTNGYGIETRRNCVNWIEKPTGYYADPKLYRANNRRSFNNGITALEQIISGQALGGMTIVDDAVSLGNDMNNLVRQNGCGNAGLKRFETNLYNFTQGKRALLLPGRETLAMLHNSNTVSFNVDDLNLWALLEGLIAENSRGWMMNSYMRGSVGNIRVVSNNSDGSPRTIRASYAFSSFGKRYNGNVQLSFSHHLPDCLYFSDAPQTCRHPSRAIINKYEKGKYQK